MLSDGLTQRREAEEFDAFAANYEKLHAESIKLTGEQPEYFAAYKAAYLARKLADSACRVLDYGCGIGLLSRHLKRLVPKARVDGFDLSEESLERVDPDLRSQGIFTSELVRLRRNYDLIVLANVLHHVRPSDRAGLFAEASSRLRSGGQLVIFEHNPANPLTRWAVAHCAFDADAVLLWPGETRRHLQRAGLRLVVRDYVVFFPRFLERLRPLETRLRWCPLGAQYAMVGQAR